jgi:hypothetical protein
VATAERVAELHHADMDHAGRDTARRATTALATALAGVMDRSVAFTAGHHAELGLAIPPERIPDLVTLYGGALFILASTPPEQLTEHAVRSSPARSSSARSPDGRAELMPAGTPEAGRTAGTAARRRGTW